MILPNVDFEIFSTISILGHFSYIYSFKNYPEIVDFALFFDPHVKLLGIFPTTQLGFLMLDHFPYCQIFITNKATDSDFPYSLKTDILQFLKFWS
jgi:hypothetical protein